MSFYTSIPLKDADGSAFSGDVQDRFDRDYSQMPEGDTDGNVDSRKGRQLDNQSVERQGRLYVDRETLVSATGQDAGLEVDDYGLTNVTTDRGEFPAGAVKTDKEARGKVTPEIGDFINGYVSDVEGEPAVPNPEPEVADPETDPEGT